MAGCYYYMDIVGYDDSQRFLLENHFFNPLLNTHFPISGFFGKLIHTPIDFTPYRELKILEK